MKTTGPRQKAYLPLALLLVILALFIVLSIEDAVFKEWKDTHASLFRWFWDLEYYGHKFLKANDRMLMDLSVFRDVKSPFASSFTGSIRRSLYMRMAPSIKEGIVLFKESTPGFLLARISQGMKYKYISLDAFDGSRLLQPGDYDQIYKFMKKNQIAYFVTDFIPSNWTQKKNLLAGKGFCLVYNNIHFMLFLLK